MNADDTFFPKGEPEDSATPPRKKKKTVVEPPAKGEHANTR